MIMGSELLSACMELGDGQGKEGRGAAVSIFCVSVYPGGRWQIY